MTGINESIKSVLKRSHLAAQLSKKNIGQEIRIIGWVEDFRDIGKLGFIMLRDTSGLVQCVLLGKILLDARNIPRQSNVSISGIVQDTKSKNFEVELKVNGMTVLSAASLSLPIDPTGRVESNLDTRLDNRALDLRNPRVLNIFLMRSGILRTIREFFFQNGFTEVNTPKIIGSASEGGSNLFSFEYFKRKGYLAQSPQLYKEQLVLSLERVFEIGPYFRAENSHTLRHLNEFQSVDLEAAYLDYSEVMDLIEELVKKILTFAGHSGKTNNDNNHIYNSTIFDNLVHQPFRRITYEECIDELNNLGERVEFGDDLTDLSLKKLGEKFDKFYFITDWPLALKPFYIHENDDNPLLSKSFDLQFGYLELVSGGTRQHDVSKLKARLKDQGLSLEGFSNHLKAFEWGMPPHSGCGLGLDRLLMVLMGENNIRETVLYPRDTVRISP